MGDALDNLTKLLKSFNNEANRSNALLNALDMSKFQLNTYEIPEPEVMHIDPEDSSISLMLQQTSEIIENSNKQIDLLTEQNNSLKELLDIKQKELDDSKWETKKAKRNSVWMAVLTVIATLIALAAWIFPSPFA